MRWIASIVVAVGLVAAGAVSASAATMSTTTTTTTTGCTVQITSLAFAPATVAPGHSSVATLQARNCTRHSQQTATYWFGRFTGSGPGIPPGCPAIDPLPRPATFAPHGTVTLQSTYPVFPSCTATALQLTVRIVGVGGAVLATGSATLAIHA